MNLFELQNSLKNIVIDGIYCVCCGYTYEEVVASIHNIYQQYPLTIFDSKELVDDVELINKLYKKLQK